jgi:Core-2/I-Branching enzyme
MEPDHIDPKRPNAPLPTSGPEQRSPTQPTIVILAHANPEQVRHLIEACRWQPIILHCDSKTPEAVFSQMTSGLPSRVIVAPRHDTRLASWSLVNAELACIRLALDRTNAEHIVVMSGSDYPLVHPSKLAALLAPFGGMSWIWNAEMPFRPWDVFGFRDGGLWRLRHYYPTRRDQILWLASKPIFNPLRRQIHPDLLPRASLQWKILSRTDAQKLLDLLDQRPDLVAFGRSTFPPDEGFIASVLASRRLWGKKAHEICHHPPWLQDWPERASQHPKWFNFADIPRIQDLLTRLSDTASVSAKGLPNDGMPLFARKFTSAHEPELLDQFQAAFW